MTEATKRNQQFSQTNACDTYKDYECGVIARGNVVIELRLSIPQNSEAKHSQPYLSLLVGTDDEQSCSEPVTMNITHEQAKALIAPKQGDLLRFERANAVIRYDGPGYCDAVFSGVIVESSSPVHQVGKGGNDWCYSDWRPA